MYDDDVSLFEDLSTELIREIFDYLAPHHLLGAFENLNSRFFSIITQHALCLPESSKMSRQIYRYYMTHILPKYGSQFRSLHFSEVQTVGAIDEFLRTIDSNLYSVLAISLRVIKIVDITQQTFQSLIDHFHHLHHVHTILISLLNVTIYRRHNKQWNYLYGEFYLPSILKTMPQLQSLSMCQRSDRIDPPFLTIFNPTNFPTARHLHTLRMSECSYHFLVSLLNSGHVPRLQYLRVTFRSSFHCPGSNNELKLSLFHESIPELRRIHFKLSMIAIGSVLMMLTDVYRYGQLEEITLDQSSCYIHENGHLVSAQDLHRWLLLSSSKSCFFQLFFNVTQNLRPMMSEQTTPDQVLVDFKALLNASITVSNTIYHKVSVFYPTSIKNQQVKLKRDHMHFKEFLNILDLKETDNSETTKMEQQLINVECFPNLHSLSFRNPDYGRNMNECIQTVLPLVLHIIDRAPRLEELCISWAENPSSSIAMWLSEMGAYNRLPNSLKRQFKDLTFGKFNDNLPFLDLVQLLINLFADGNLEQLIFTHCLPSDVLQTFDSFQQGICLLVERLPKLIYLSIHVPSFLNMTIERMQLTKWLSGEIEPKLARYAHWRYRDKTLNLWF